MLQLGWELSPRATTELRDAMILHLGHRVGQGLCWEAPAAAEQSRAQLPAAAPEQGWESRGCALTCVAALGSVGNPGTTS